jgi:1,2-phenylacetyl-CoA epoxidase PaaB subunit
MEQVVARWRRLVAFMKALDLLHQVMLAVLHCRTTMAIEMARARGAFVRRRRLF